MVQTLRGTRRANATVNSSENQMSRRIILDSIVQIKLLKFKGAERPGDGRENGDLRRRSAKDNI